MAHPPVGRKHSGATGSEHMLFALRDPPGGICIPLLNTHALYSPMESIEPKQARLLRAGSALGERLDTCPGHRVLRTRQYIYARPVSQSHQKL